MPSKAPVFEIISPNWDPNGDHKIALESPRKPSASKGMFERVLLCTSVVGCKGHNRLTRSGIQGSVLDY